MIYLVMADFQVQKDVTSYFSKTLPVPKQSIICRLQIGNGLQKRQVIPTPTYLSFIWNHYLSPHRIIHDYWLSNHFIYPIHSVHLESRHVAPYSFVHTLNCDSSLSFFTFTFEWSWRKFDRNQKYLTSVITVFTRFQTVKSQCHASML